MRCRPTSSKCSSSSFSSSYDAGSNCLQEPGWADGLSLTTEWSASGFTFSQRTYPWESEHAYLESTVRKFGIVMTMSFLPRDVQTVGMEMLISSGG